MELAHTHHEIDLPLHGGVHLGDVSIEVQRILSGGQVILKVHAPMSVSVLSGERHAEENAVANGATCARCGGTHDLLIYGGGRRLVCGHCRQRQKHRQATALRDRLKGGA